MLVVLPHLLHIFSVSFTRRHHYGRRVVASVCLIKLRTDSDDMLLANQSFWLLVAIRIAIWI